MLKGIDASFWQDEINFGVAKEHGISFAFLRAQFGNNLDGRFHTNWNGAKDFEIFRGAYFFPIKKTAYTERSDF